MELKSRDFVSYEWLKNDPSGDILQHYIIFVLLYTSNTFEEVILHFHSYSLIPSQSLLNNQPQATIKLGSPLQKSNLEKRRIQTLGTGGFVRGIRGHLPEFFWNCIASIMQFRSKSWIIVKYKRSYFLLPVFHSFFLVEGGVGWCSFPAPPSLDPPMTRNPWL